MSRFFSGATFHPSIVQPPKRLRPQSPEAKLWHVNCCINKETIPVYAEERCWPEDNDCKEALKAFAECEWVTTRLPNDTTKLKVIYHRGLEDEVQTVAYYDKSHPKHKWLEYRKRDAVLYNEAEKLTELYYGKRGEPVQKPLESPSSQSSEDKSGPKSHHHKCSMQ